MNKIHRTSLFLSLFGILSTCSITAQEVYNTQKARIIITTQINQNQIQFASNQLVLMLNYETAEFELKLNLNTLKTGIDSIDKKMAALENEYLHIIGKFDIESIITKGHPPKYFSFEGILIPKNSVVFGKSHLEHIADRSNTACILSMQFLIDSHTLENELSRIVDYSDLEISIVQAVLPRSTD